MNRKVLQVIAAIPGLVMLNNAIGFILTLRAQPQVLACPY